MGLDTSHDAYHGSYGTFDEWRQHIAKIANVPYAWDWATLPVDSELQGHWTREPEDALLYLIAHSDADGELSPYRCARLADRLSGLLPLLPPEPNIPGYRSRRGITERFIAGLRLAARNNEVLDFH